MSVQHIIETSGPKTKPTYHTSAEVPAGLANRDQWQQQERKVKNGAEHRAVFELVEHDSETGCKEYSSDRLYAFEDTTPIRPIRPDPHLDAFWDHFVKDHNHNNGLIWWSKRDNGWKTFLPTGLQNRFRPSYLRKGEIKAHILQREIFGIFGGAKTRWLTIDVDRHPTKDNPITEAHNALFLEQLAVLQKHFSDPFFQVKDEYAEGVHLFRLMPHGSLDQYRHDLRQLLAFFDQKYPDLAARAEKLGMKTLGQLEIYPDPKNGFRLPLAKDRTLLVDRPLAKVLNRQKRPVQDVANFMAWINDPCRQYMPPAQVFEYVRCRLKPVGTAPIIIPTAPKPDVVRKPNTAPSSGRITSRLPHKLQGCYRQTMIDYWSSKLVVPNSLDAMLLATGRILPLQNPDDSEGEAVLYDLLQGLTDFSVSDRLVKNDWKAIDKNIRRVVRIVYHREPSAENEKLVEVAAAFARRGFRVDDRSTWRKIDFTWTPAELATIEDEFRPMFPKAGGLELGAALRHFIVYMHGKTGGEYDIRSFHLPFSQFCGITLGKTAKKVIFKDKLLRLGWLQVRTRPYKPPGGQKGRATGYAIGPALRCKIAKTGPSEATIEAIMPEWAGQIGEEEEVDALNH